MSLHKAVALAAEVRRKVSSGTTTKRLIEELDRSGKREAAYAALAYALCELAGEEAALQLGIPFPERREAMVFAAQRQTLLRLSAFLKESIYAPARELKDAPPPEGVPNYLAALVIRNVGGHEFEKRYLRPVLRTRNMPLDAFQLPPAGESVYPWAVRNGLVRAPSSDPLKQLLKMRDDRFAIAMLKEAAGRGALPVHPAIAARRLALGKALELQFRDRIKKVEGEAQIRLRQGGQTSKVFQDVQAIYRERGRFLAGQRLAEAELAKLRVALLRLFQSRDFIQKRASCLQKAARAMADDNPGLWETVLTEVEAHQKRCPESLRPFPCKDCAPEVAYFVRARLRQRATSDGPSGAVNAPGTSQAGGMRGQQPAPKEEPLVVAVGVRFGRETRMAGLAWVAEDGRVGVAVEETASPKEAARRAIGRAWSDLRSADGPLLIVGPNTKAVRQARELLGTHGKPTPTVLPGFPPDLRGRSDRVTVIRGGFGPGSRHAASAARLAAQALAVVHGQSSREELAAEAKAVSEQLGGTGEIVMSLPGDEVLQAAAAKAKTTPQKPQTTQEDTAPEETAPRLLGPEDEIAEPQVTRAKTAEWTWPQVLRAEHLRLSRWPLPPRIWNLVSTWHQGRYVPVVIRHGVQPARGKRLVRELRAELGKGYLSLQRGGLLGYFFPGMIVDCTWSLDRSSLTISPRPLPSPPGGSDRVIAYEYDVRALVRDTPPGGWRSQAGQDLTVEQWVLRTLQILGYLDPHGRALLTEDALQRNMLTLGFPREKLALVEEAVKELIGRGELKYVQGSLDPDGRPAFPACPRRPAIRLLCYEPDVERLLQQRAQGEESTHVKRSAHEVAPFIRRLPEGKSASRKAREGYAEAVRRAELVGDDELPPGYTFVPRHSRGR